MKESTHINHKNLSMNKTRRPKQRLNKTEMAILAYLLGKTTADDFGYSIYASDPKLQVFTDKSRQQLQRALRHLEERGLVSSSHTKPFRGTPILFSLTFPQYCHVKRLLGRSKGNLLAHYIDLKHYLDTYVRRTHNPITSTEIAWHFNVKKRTAQRALKELVQNGVMRRTHIWRWSRRRRRNVKVPAYELTEGQKPLTHWTEEE